MTQSQIHYFITVVNEGGITRAANRLFVSQPAISKSISTLERELGFPLLNRQDNATSPTYAGELLYKFFVRIMAEYGQLIKTIERDSAQTSMQLRIGCPSNWNPEKFYDRITKHFAEQHPAVRLSIECFQISELIIMLKNKQLDMILVLNLHDPAQLGLRARQIAVSNCGLLYAKRYFKNVRSIDDFKGVDFLGYDSNVQGQFEIMIHEACQGAFIPKFRNCGNYDAAVFEMSRGGGIMFVMDWESKVRSELFSFLPLFTALPVNVMCLADNPNPYISAYADELAELFRE